MQPNKTYFMFGTGGQTRGGFGELIQALSLNSTRKAILNAAQSSFFWPATPLSRGSTALIIPFTVSN
jgi:hypothetical protein